MRPNEAPEPSLSHRTSYHNMNAPRAESRRRKSFANEAVANPYSSGKAAFPQNTDDVMTAISTVLEKVSDLVSNKDYIRMYACLFSLLLQLVEVCKKRILLY